MHLGAKDHYQYYYQLSETSLHAIDEIARSEKLLQCHVIKPKKLCLF